MTLRWMSLLLLQLLLNLAAMGTHADVPLSREPKTRAQTMPIFYKFTVTENENVGQSELICTCFSFLGFQDGINRIDSNTNLPFRHDYDPSRNLTLKVLCTDAVECFSDDYEDDYEAPSVLWNETLEIRVKGEENTNVVGFDCKYTRKNVNCSWSRGHLAPADTVYKMFYHYKDIEVQECPTYIVKSGLRVGCYFTPDEKARSVEHHFYVNGTSSSSSSSSVAIRPFYLKAFPASLCFTETPTNLHASSDDDTSINITWTSDCRKKCLSLVSITENVSGKREILEVRHGADALVDLLYSVKRNLSIKVRTQFVDEDGCQWSAWSESLTLGVSLCCGQKYQIRP
ncbi:interleukin-13 receptor subunit alpha-2-like isoform X2 [Petromyzon marinus]|uniref:interleukin-13 receptor subunit alpha-2-like isoform X2 n=1 Tax=Petromyzon marinus TaxID=7757 RepID=UPI003F708D0E